MKYPKPPLPFSAQADLLLERGLLADRDALIQKLQAVNYYRLSAYWHTFRDLAAPGERLLPGTTLDAVWRRYRFDRQLRLRVMDAIERVEIAIRTRIVNRHTLQHGAFGYLNRATLPGLSMSGHRTLIDKIRRESEFSHEDFVAHYQQKYTSETDLPLWMACELLTFGGTLTLFGGLSTRMKKDVAAEFGLNVPLLGSWLRAINHVRNICAHHSRLWNRELRIRPMLPYKETHPAWHHPVPIPDARLFGVLTVLHFFLRQVAPHSAWKQRLQYLLADYPDVPIRFMGFPDNWEESPLWQDAGDMEKEGGK